MSGVGLSSSNPNPNIEISSAERKAVKEWAKGNLTVISSVNGRRITQIDESKIKKLSPEQRAIVLAAFKMPVPGDLKINKGKVSEIIGQLQRGTTQTEKKKGLLGVANSVSKHFKQSLGAHVGVQSVKTALEIHTEKAEAKQALYGKGEVNKNVNRDLAKEQSRVAKTSLLVLKASEKGLSKVGVSERQMKQSIVTLQRDHNVTVLTNDKGHATAMARKVSDTYINSGTFKDVHSGIGKEGKMAIGFGRYQNEDALINIDNWERDLHNEIGAAGALKDHKNAFVLPVKLSYTSADNTIHEVVVMPFAEGGDGLHWLNKSPPNTERAEFISQLLGAVKTLENENCVHFDMKLQNMLKEGGKWKISDFGSLIQLKTGEKAGKSGTPGYMAPEIAWGGKGNIKANGFSVGVMLAEICGLQQFRIDLTNCQSEQEYLNAINHLRGKLLNEAGGNQLMQVIAGLLDPDPKTRLSAHDAEELLNNSNLEKDIENMRNKLQRPKIETPKTTRNEAMEPVASATPKKDDKIIGLVNDNGLDLKWTDAKNISEKTPVLRYTEKQGFHIVNKGKREPLTDIQKEILLAEGVDGLHKILKFKTSQEINNEFEFAENNNLKMNTDEARKLLENQESGTVLLRYSEREQNFYLVTKGEEFQPKLTEDQKRVLLTEGVEGLRKLIPEVKIPSELG